MESSRYFQLYPEANVVLTTSLPTPTCGSVLLENPFFFLSPGSPTYPPPSPRLFDPLPSSLTASGLPPSPPSPAFSIPPTSPSLPLPLPPDLPQHPCPAHLLDRPGRYVYCPAHSPVTPPYLSPSFHPSSIPRRSYTSAKSQLAATLLT